eukprot:CAMPEP_0198146252 /NCGR_PEP_ID=MMETSP1443-20131203/28411_1 /TAXON_ID=186043 /ORGANISM="Entomoneis sp., Strain CCMP2396" /LENGTH=226 /DNA_ID=CAMNT_0043810149 /DNA_START=18 /DNA_END=698 /DNA_ORIENTATION=+
MALQSIITGRFLSQQMDDRALQNAYYETNKLQKSDQRTTLARKKKSKAKLHVRFASVNKEFNAPTEYLEVSVSSCWHSDEQFEFFRACHMHNSKKMARKGVFQNGAISAAFAMSQILDQESLPPLLAAKLHKCLKDRSKIGLERFADRQVFRDKRLRRRKLYEVVEEIQARGFRDERKKAGLLRIACEDISHTSVMFAQYLGYATTTMDSQQTGRFVNESNENNAE